MYIMKNLKNSFSLIFSALQENRCEYTYPGENSHKEKAIIISFIIALTKRRKLVQYHLFYSIESFPILMKSAVKISCILCHETGSVEVNVVVAKRITNTKYCD